MEYSEFLSYVWIFFSIVPTILVIYYIWKRHRAHSKETRPGHLSD